jgi:hypothetical protein
VVDVDTGGRELGGGLTLGILGANLRAADHSPPDEGLAVAIEEAEVLGASTTGVEELEAFGGETGLL